MRPICLIPLAALALASSALAQDAPVFGTLDDPDPGMRMPLPIEPQFAEPGTKTFAAMLVDLRTEPGPHLQVFHMDDDIKQPLPEEPKPD